MTVDLVNALLAKLLNKLQRQIGGHKKRHRIDFLAFSKPSSQNQWENFVFDMNFKKCCFLDHPNAVYLSFLRPYIYDPYMYGNLPDICRTFAAQKPLIKMAVFLFHFLFFDSIMGIVYGKCTWPYTKKAVHFAL